MSCLDELIEAGRESEDRMRWGQAIRLLALDSVELFKEELGLESAIVSPIRQIAREWLEHTGTAWTDESASRELVQAFRQQVSERLGSEVADALGSWRDELFPPSQVLSCLMTWGSAIMMLWDELTSTTRPAKIALSAGARSAIDDFVGEVRAILDKTAAVQSMSQWDSMCEDSFTDDYVTTTIFGAAQNRYTSRWLSALPGRLSPEDIEVLTQWWHVRPWSDECLMMGLQQNSCKATT